MGRVVWLDIPDIGLYSTCDFCRRELVRSGEIPSVTVLVTDRLLRVWGNNPKGKWMEVTRVVHTKCLHRLGERMKDEEFKFRLWDESRKGVPEGSVMELSRGQRRNGEIRRIRLCRGTGVEDYLKYSRRAYVPGSEWYRFWDEFEKLESGKEEVK